MIGIGLDAVEIGRFREALKRHPRIVDRVFTEFEREDLAKRDDPVPGFAARFAVREAVMKALGAGIGDVAFTDIGVRRAETGQPHLELTGAAARLAETRGVKGWKISITHTDNTAMAVVAAL